MFAKQLVIKQKDWAYNQVSTIHAIEETFSYPIIAKPVDDGCSAGVIKLTHSAMLLAYAAASFRNEPLIEPDLMQLLALPSGDYIPRQERFLLEELIQKDQETIGCLETTTGLLTHMDPNGKTLYEIFEPSETVAADAILSLEEKFLAGEGHNITPARFHKDSQTAGIIRKSVKSTLADIAKVLNLQGYARIDAFVKIYSHEKVEVWVIEINALPAMTPATCIFHQATLNGYTPFDFIDAIIQYGLSKINFTTSLAAEKLER